MTKHFITDCQVVCPFCGTGMIPLDVRQARLAGDGHFAHPFNWCVDSGKKFLVTLPRLDAKEIGGPDEPGKS